MVAGAMILAWLIAYLTLCMTALVLLVPNPQVTVYCGVPIAQLTLLRVEKVPIPTMTLLTLQGKLPSPVVTLLANV